MFGEEYKSALMGMKGVLAELERLCDAHLEPLTL